jgi:hypothetical protein
VNQRVKDTAVALLERAENVRRGTVRMFQASMMPPAQKVAQGQPASSVHQKAATILANKAAKPVVRMAHYLTDKAGPVIKAALPALKQRAPRSGPRLGP